MIDEASLYSKTSFDSMVSSLQEYLEILADMPMKHESHDISDDCDSNQRLCDELFEGDDQVFEDPESQPLQHSIKLQDNGFEESSV